MVMLRRITAVLASVTVLLAVAPSPARAAGGSYVALGDSFSSGTGTRSYLRDGTSCQRSVYAYPSLIARSRALSLNLRACSGATTADVANLQLGALTSATAYVSITVGGNDAGFTDVLTACALPAWAGNCNGAIDRAQHIINNRLPGRLRTVYASIRSRAPQARVVVAGYPRIFNGEDCNALTWFSPTEQARLNASADLLNARVSAAARAAGFTFSSPVVPFERHAVCADQEWLNGLSFPTGESYHPNRRGHSAGYYPLIAASLTGPVAPTTAVSRPTAESQARRLSRQQHRYAALDRSIRPEVFRRPDLTSRETRRAATRAGVDLRSRASIDAVDRRYAERQARAHR
jgi:lysophospholipase L1-like esterase